MSLRYASFTVFNVSAIASANTLQGFNHIDVSNFDKYCLVIKNHNTAISLTNLRFQGAIDSSASDNHPYGNWISIASTDLVIGNSAGPTQTVMSQPYEGAWHWIRLTAIASSTAAIGTVSVTIGGFERS